MGAKSIAAKAANRASRFRMRKIKMGNIFKDSILLSYPNCASFSKECPQSIEDPVNPPTTCRVCPQFMDSPYNKKDGEAEKRRAKELSELFSAMRKK